MIDLSTGRFTFGQGKEVYRGMKLEDFKKTAMFENELFSEKYKEKHNAVRYHLKTQQIEGFEVEVCFSFDKSCDRLEGFEFTTLKYGAWPNWPDNYGPQHKYEHENVILSYLYDFLASQIGTIEGGRELSFRFEWGEITSIFSPFFALPHDPDIRIFIKYDIDEFITPNPQYAEQAILNAKEMGLSDEEIQELIGKFKNG